MPNSLSKEQVERERVEFEAWVTNDASYPPKRFNAELYELLCDQYAWDAWQARAALSREAAPVAFSREWVEKRECIDDGHCVTAGAPTRQEIINHDFPTYAAFFNRHALGSKLPPSCLVCGQAQPSRDTWAIINMELPNIIVCTTCRDKAIASPTAPEGVSVPLEPTEEMLNAGVNAWFGKPPEISIDYYHNCMTRAYKAMLAASITDGGRK